MLENSLPSFSGEIDPLMQTLKCKQKVCRKKKSYIRRDTIFQCLKCQKDLKPVVRQFSSILVRFFSREIKIPNDHPLSRLLATLVWTSYPAQKYFDLGRTNLTVLRLRHLSELCRNLKLCPSLWGDLIHQVYIEHIHLNHTASTETTSRRDFFQKHNKRRGCLSFMY